MPVSELADAQAWLEMRLRDDQAWIASERLSLQQVVGIESTRGQAWEFDAWLASLSLHRAAVTALALPPGEEAFSYVKTKLEAEVKLKLKAAKLEGLVPYILEGIETLKKQKEATADELNRKFAIDGSGSVELTYGSMETFNAGLEGFIGPPFM